MCLNNEAGNSTSQINIRPPEARDGNNVYELIANSPPLDINSRYCNLLQCHHFSETSALADDPEGIAGFVSGYLVPDKPGTLFIWQVAVARRARGQGLAARLIQHILRRPACDNVQFIRTTITADNKPSWRLFEKLAINLNAFTESRVLFDEETHFQGHHGSEHLFIIGPINQNQ